MNDVLAIYQQHSTALYRFSLGLCGDSHLARDLVAETFVRAMMSSTPIVTETVRAYLCMIARRLYLKEWHRGQRHGALDDEAFADTRAGPEQQAMATQSLNRTLIALQRIPEADRTALLMRAEDEVPYEDIARALDITLANAKVKVSRARVKLALYLKDET